GIGASASRRAAKRIGESYGQHTPETRRPGNFLPGPVSRLPDAASVRRFHRLALVAAEGFSEVRQILHHAVHAVLLRRVRIRLHLKAFLLGTHGAAPALAVRQEE